MDQENCQPVGVKTCSKCQTEKPFDDYWTSKTSKDGLQYWCKACYSERERENWRAQKLKRQRDEDADSESEMQGGAEPVKEEPKTANDSLYIFRNPIMPGVLKIGRSVSPETRCKSLSASHPFIVQIVATYGGLGFLERAIHLKLHSRRVTEGTGTEWFRIEPWQADLIIRGTALEYDLNHPDPSESKGISAPSKNWL